jgi:hypothetical protein
MLELLSRETQPWIQADMLSVVDTLCQIIESVLKKTRSRAQSRTKTSSVEGACDDEKGPDTMPQKPIQYSGTSFSS